VRHEFDWNLYALAATIELERHRKRDPVLPDWLSPSYELAWESLVKFALADLAGKPAESTLRCALSVVALGRGEIKLGALLNHAETDEIAAHVEDNLAWVNRGPWLGCTRTLHVRWRLS
jgi:hypothetical protein